jgi:hypothetical protein
VALSVTTSFGTLSVTTSFGTTVLNGKYMTTDVSKSGVLSVYGSGGLLLMASPPFQLTAAPGGEEAA